MKETVEQAGFGNKCVVVTILTLRISAHSEPTVQNVPFPAKNISLCPTPETRSYIPRPVCQRFEWNVDWRQDRHCLLVQTSENQTLLTAHIFLTHKLSLICTFTDSIRIRFRNSLMFFPWFKRISLQLFYNKLARLCYTKSVCDMLVLYQTTA